MIAPNHGKKHPARLHRAPFYRRWKLPGWLAIPLVICWGLISWWLGTSFPGIAEKKQQGFRKFIEQQVLIYDGWQKLTNADARLSRLSIDEVEFLTDMRDLYDQADVQGRVSGEAWLELALLYHRFKDVEGVDYTQMYDILELDVSGDESIYAAVCQLWNEEEMSSEERTFFLEYYATQPNNWALNYLASQHGMVDQQTLAALAVRTDKYLWNYVLASGMMVLLILASLALIWKLPTWLPAGEFPKRYRRWSSCWSVKNVMAAVAGLDLVGKAGVYGFILMAWIAMGIAAYGAFAAQQALLWVYMTVTVLLSLITFAFWACALIHLLTPGWRRFCETMGLTLQDFKNGRYWAAGVILATLTFLTFWLIELSMEALGLGGVSFSGLDRDMHEYGIFALPMMIVWACIMAPLVEEVIFRGFLYRVIQRRWGVFAGMMGSSVVFAYVHFYDTMGFFFIVLYGLLFCAVFQRTGKLTAGVILHCCINSLITWFGWMTNN